MRWFWITLSTTLAFAQEKECPYINLPTTVTNILTSDLTYCPEAVRTCIVNRTCYYNESFTGYQALGTFRSLNLTSLGLNANFINQDMSKFDLPDTLTTLRLSRFNYIGLPAGFKWPSKLHTLNFTNMAALPTNMPTTITILLVRESGLTALPSIPSSVSVLLLSGNTFSNRDLQSINTRNLLLMELNRCGLPDIIDVDWRNVSYVTISSNPNLNRIENLKFDNNLKFLGLGNTTIKHWVMNNETYHAVNALTPKRKKRGVVVENDTYYEGYSYEELSISSDAAECATQNGTIKQIWADASNRTDDYKNRTYTVCVLSVATPPPTPEQASSNTGLIIGIAAGVTVLVGAAVFFYTRRRTEQKFTITTGNNYSVMQSTQGVFTDDVAVALSELSLLRLDESNLVLSKKLGSGAFANVWLGKFGETPVAVKALHGNQLTSRVITSFIDEIQLMSTFDSPFVIKLIGATWSTPSDIKCVMELMDGGDLKDYLDTHSSKTTTWDEKYEHIYCIAQGLLYLHSMNIIHRDLKSRNILLDSTKGTKLTDFGISKEDIQATMTVGVGTFRWMAPEVIQDHNYTVAADIYSFGCILSEFDTHCVPYEDIKNPINGQPLTDPAIMVKVVAGTIKPSFTKSCPEWIHELADQCLAHRPEDRPTSGQLAHVLQKRIREFSARPK